MTKRLLLLLLFSFTQLLPGLAQPRPTERESAGYWATKGQSLMQAGHYAEAYSAFQLAKSLGAEGMTAQMELAKKRNLNSIQLRALISEAHLLATTDPTQSLRLLEYARQQFPDSAVLLKVIGEVANLPDNWYYTLRADSIRASPKFTYLLADTDKTRLYLCRGDSLTLIHTFAEKPGMRVFSPNDDYLFVTTGNGKKGALYALKGPKLTLHRSVNDPVLTATFSPNRNPAYGSWLLTVGADKTRLIDLSPAQTTFVFLPITNADGRRWPNSGYFSPGGRYFTTRDGVWQLTQQNMTWVSRPGNDGWTDYMTYTSARFSDDDRHVLFMKNASGTSTFFRFTFLGYTFSERGDSLHYTGERKIGRPTGRAPWRPFSFDSKYLSISDSLYFFEQRAWKFLRPVRDSNDIVFQPTNPNQRSLSRFSPDSTYLLLEAVGSHESQLIELWRLAGSERHFVQKFDSESELINYVFSADGKFLLARNADTDKLWRMDKDQVSLVHTFVKSSRPPTALDRDDYPRSSAYFSPKNKYLITYSANATDADSLWEIKRKGETNGLVPVRAFKTRLNPAQTQFSPDEKWLLTEGSGPQPAQLWNLTEQQVALRQDLESGMEQALFSPKGNYLLTYNRGGQYIWNVTNRALVRINGFEGFNPTSRTVNGWRFSPDERHLAHAIDGYRHGSAGSSWVYRLRPTGLETIRGEDGTRAFLYMALPGNAPPVLDTYQTGKFSPDGLQWLQSQVTTDFTNPVNQIPQPDTLWNLTANGLTFALRVDKFVDNYNVKEERKAGVETTHSEPATLFSPDSRLLMTTENGRIRFYGRKPGTTIGPMPGPSVGGRPLWGWPLYVSAKADYWFIKPLKFYGGEPPRDDRDDYRPLYGNGVSSTPDTAQIWRRSGTDWKLIAKFSQFYEGMNQFWHNTRQQSWFSPMGNYLLMPTTKPALTTLFSLTGDQVRPVFQLNKRVMSAALVSPNPANGAEVGMLYTDTEQKTYLLRMGSNGTRTTSLGFGTLHHPPKSLEQVAYWVRKIDDSQQTVELLDVDSGQTLVRVPFGAILDFTVRPDGNVWVVSSVGARLIRSPGEVLNWLKIAPVAPLSAELKGVFVFL